MTFTPFRRFAGSGRCFHDQLAGTILLFLLSLVLAAPAAAQEKTLFLPLKVNTLNAASRLTAQADQALQEAVKAQGQEMLPRGKAEAVFAYGKTWPPSSKEIRAFGAGKEIDYLVTGSITEAGAELSIDLAAHDLLSAAPPKYFYAETATGADLHRALSSLVTRVLDYTERYSRIAAIQVKGNKRIDTGAILHNVHSKVGGRYRPALLRDDLKRVFRMGYFADVKIDVTNTEQGKQVTFIVKEKPVIGRIKITGAEKIKKKDVRGAISLRAGNIINSRQVRESVANIRHLYKEKGFYDTKVTAKLSTPKPNRVDIDFTIEEGQKIYIKQINFVGNQAFSNGELRKVISTSTKGLFSWLTDSGLLKRDVVEQDADRIQAFYSNHGYIDAVVGRPIITQKGEWLYVTFDISEGARYKVGKVALRGQLIESKAQLMKLVKLTGEHYFDRKTLRNDILRLTDLYADQGYAFAEANPSIEKVPGRKVNITITLTKGDLVHINRIIIRGNTRTRDKVIRRQMEVKEGGIFKASAIRESNENLQRLGYFSQVNITPEQTASKNLMDILVHVKERPTGSFSIGAGYSSVDQLLFMAQISQNNFLGKGEQMSLEANLSANSARYNFSFTEPNYNDSDLLVGFNLYNWEREYDDFTRNSYGGALRFGYPVWEKWKAYWSYSYDDTTLSDVEANASYIILQSENLHTTSSIQLAFERDTRNRAYNPTAGSVNTISMKYAGGPLGGEAQFTKLEASSSWYFPFKWDTTFHIKYDAAHLFKNGANKLPVFERFFLGGIDTIRGFDYAEVSPRAPDQNGVLQKVGGTTMWYTNLEYIFPLVKKAGLDGVIFFDAGDSYASDVPHTIYDRVRYSTGFGFRWLSPMGPLRLEWGYNLHPVGDEKHSNWDFSIGGNY